MLADTLGHENAPFEEMVAGYLKLYAAPELLQTGIPAGAALHGFGRNYHKPEGRLRHAELLPRDKKG